MSLRGAHDAAAPATPLPAPLPAPRIRPARPDEAAALSALALRSKAHWGYTPEQLAVFRAELTLAPEAIVPGRTHVAEAEGRVAGFYSLAAREGGSVELEHVFVEPGRLGRGVGRALFAHACEVARAAGFTVLEIQSDPNAAGFYRRLGARLVGEIPSSIPGRTIPFFSLRLGDDAPR